MERDGKGGYLIEKGFVFYLFDLKLSFTSFSYIYGLICLLILFYFNYCVVSFIHLSIP